MTVMSSRIKFALAAVAAITLSGCNITWEEPGPVVHETRSVDLDRSDMARVRIKMGAGELKVAGGSPRLMDADFAYNVPEWKPIVQYDAGGFRGNLTVEQPNSGVHAGGKVTYNWDLRLNDKLPLDVAAELGAGEARMNLGALNLRSVDVEMGVGQLDLDLRGKPSRDYDVKIHGGVGQATVYLPADAGISATAAGGIGHIEVRGLVKRGDERGGEWINPAHENAPATIHVDVQGGVGEIRLIAE